MSANDGRISYVDSLYKHVTKGSFVIIKYYNKYGEVQGKFKATGKGNYPWRCAAKIKYPNDMIFENRYGVWFYESELDEISHGIYKVNGTRRNQRNKEFLD